METVRFFEESSDFFCFKGAWPFSTTPVPRVGDSIYFVSRETDGVSVKGKVKDVVWDYINKQVLVIYRPKV